MLVNVRPASAAPERPRAVMQRQVGLKRGERKVMRAGVVSGPPHAERTDRTIEDAMAPTAAAAAAPAAGQRDSCGNTGGKHKEPTAHRPASLSAWSRPSCLSATSRGLPSDPY